MIPYVFRRLGYSVIVLFGLSTIVFGVTRLIGDPARLMLPMGASEEQYLLLRARLGLDDPLMSQFRDFLFGLVQGDFGNSLTRDVPALPLVLGYLPATLYLAAATITFALAVALPLGIIAAMKPRSIADRVATALAMIGVSTPVFWLALMLIVIFAVNLGWFRTSGYGGLSYLVLPVLALSAQSIGRMAEVVRSSMIEQFTSPYVTTARAKGLRERIVITRHALRNAALPIVTISGDELATLISGAVVIEVVFAWPGVGRLMIESIQNRDFPVIQATVLVVASFIVLLNLFVDITYAFLDPRIRYS